MKLDEIRHQTRLGRLLLEKGLIDRRHLAAAMAEQKANRSLTLGQALVARGLISREQLEECLHQQAHVRVFRQTRLGNLLIERGLVDKTQLDQAVADQKRRQGMTLGELLVEQGAISERDLRSCLRHQCYLRLSAAVLALSITPFQSAFADDREPEPLAGGLGHAPDVREQLAEHMRDDDPGRVYGGGAALGKMMDVALKAAWKSWTDSPQMQFTLSSSDGPTSSADYRLRLGSDSVRISYTIKY